mmetsp:Transcript_310/g.1208  ORF Transcript_310/g.1208 Transcript_310/m.1208 type:complete len:300 (-) Transcript_310:667-1566(-)
MHRRRLRLSLSSLRLRRVVRRSELLGVLHHPGGNEGRGGDLVPREPGERFLVRFDAGVNRTLEPPARFRRRRFVVVGIVGPSATVWVRVWVRVWWARRRERDARGKPTAAAPAAMSHRAMSHRAMRHRGTRRRVWRRRRVDPLRRGNRRTGRTRRRRRRGRMDTRDTRAVRYADGRASLPPRRRSLELPPRFRRERSDGGSLNGRSLSEPRGVARELPIVHLRVETALRVVGWVNAVRYAVRYEASPPVPSRRRRARLAALAPPPRPRLSATNEPWPRPFASIRLHPTPIRVVVPDDPS